MAEKILIVDDDLDSLKLIGLMLQRHGYEVVAANSGTQALAKAANDHPSLIILDVMMPDMDGYEVMQCLRENPETRDIPVVAVSANAMPKDLARGKAAGFVDYLTKPLDIEQLLDRADAAVPLSRQSDKKKPSLRGRTQINLFFEASTRTQGSFEIAGKRLGAQVTNMSVRTSSISKGETLIDTAATLNAMQPDVIIVRHPASGAVELLSQKVGCSVINAGDGWNEHPSQALIDIFALRRGLGRRQRGFIGLV